MKKKVKQSSFKLHDNIIDEIRQHRLESWHEFKRNPEEFLKNTNKIMIELGSQYKSPSKRKT